MAAGGIVVAKAGAGAEERIGAGLKLIDRRAIQMGVVFRGGRHTRGFMGWCKIERLP